jgi:putative SOS response-associated peptidase YedK
MCVADIVEINIQNAAAPAWEDDLKPGFPQNQQIQSEKILWYKVRFPPESELFAFAGIWDGWRDGSGKWLKTCPSSPRFPTP